MNLKKLWPAFVLVAMSSLMLASCGGEDDEKKPESYAKFTPTSHLDGKMQIYAEPWQTVNSYTFESGWYWETTVYFDEDNEDGEWLIVTPGKGDPGSAEVSIEPEPNYTGHERAAVVSFTSGKQKMELHVTQLAVNPDGNIPEPPTQGTEKRVTRVEGLLDGAPYVNWTFEYDDNDFLTAYYQTFADGRTGKFMNIKYRPAGETGPRPQVEYSDPTAGRSGNARIYAGDHITGQITDGEALFADGKVMYSFEYDRNMTISRTSAFYSTSESGTPTEAVFDATWDTYRNLEGVRRTVGNTESRAEATYSNVPNYCNYGIDLNVLLAYPFHELYAGFYGDTEPVFALRRYYVGLHSQHLVSRIADQEAISTYEYERNDDSDEVNAVKATVTATATGASHTYVFRITYEDYVASTL